VGCGLPAELVWCNVLNENAASASVRVFGVRLSSGVMLESARGCSGGAIV